MAYIYALSDTWNAAGTTFTGIGLNVTDSASAAGSLLMDLQVGGASRAMASKSGTLAATTVVPATPSSSFPVGMSSPSAGILRFARSNNSAPTFSALNTIADIAYDGTDYYLDLSNTLSSFRIGGDTRLFRDAANTLAQRNGTNAQTFRVYNTFTDASNYERGFMRWSSNVLEMGREFAGTGINRDVRIRSQFLYINVNSNDTFTFGASSHISTANIIFGADNTFDIGASGTSRPRNLYLGSNLLVSSGAGVGRTSADIQFYDGAVNVVKDFQLIGKFLSFSEQTAPAAPATNDVRVYAEDNGSGKTRLMARFATGAAVQIAIEP